MTVPPVDSTVIQFVAEEGVAQVLMFAKVVVEDSEYILPMS